MKGHALYFFVFSIAGPLILNAECGLNGCGPNPVSDQPVPMEGHPGLGLVVTLTGMSPKSFSQGGSSRKDESLH